MTDSRTTDAEHGTLGEDEIEAILDAIPQDVTGHSLVQLLGSIIFSYSRTDREAFDLWQETSTQILGFLAERAAQDVKAKAEQAGQPVH